MHILQFHPIKFVPIKTIYEFFFSRGILYLIQTNQNESISDHLYGFESYLCNILGTW